MLIMACLTSVLQTLQSWAALQTKTLEGSPYAWLGEMLNAFNNGDLHAYDTLCSQYSAQLNAQPALVADERKLREKITIACLMELIFTYASGEALQETVVL